MSKFSLGLKSVRLLLDSGLKECESIFSVLSLSAYTYKNTTLHVGDLGVLNICWCDCCRISFKNMMCVYSLRENKVTAYLKRKIKKTNFEL